MSTWPAVFRTTDGPRTALRVRAGAVDGTGRRPHNVPAGPAGTRPAPDRDPRVNDAPGPPDRLDPTAGPSAGSPRRLEEPRLVRRRVRPARPSSSTRYWNAKPGKPTDDQKAALVPRRRRRQRRGPEGRHPPGPGRDVFATDQPVAVRPGLPASGSSPCSSPSSAGTCSSGLRTCRSPSGTPSGSGSSVTYFNSILPGSVGGDILKAVAVARDRAGRPWPSPPS